MRPWVIWMIKNHLTWLVKCLIICAYPIHILAYYKEAWHDIIQALYAIDYIKRK